MNYLNKDYVPEDKEVTDILNKFYSGLLDLQQEPDYEYEKILEDNFYELIGE